LTDIELGKSYQNGTFIKMILVWLLFFTKFVMFCVVKESSFNS